MNIINQIRRYCDVLIHRSCGHFFIPIEIINWEDYWLGTYRYKNQKTAKEEMERWSNKWFNEAKTEKLEPIGEKYRSLELSGAEDQKPCKFVVPEEGCGEDILFIILSTIKFMFVHNPRRCSDYSTGWTIRGSSRSRANCCFSLL